MPIDKYLNDVGLCSRIVLAIKEMPCDNRDENLDYLMNLVYFEERPIGFFDGVVAGGECGVGNVLKSSGFHFYRVHIILGTGTNIKAELLSLWGFLMFVKRCHIAELMVVGDSKVVLDWFDGKSQLNALNFHPWKKKIMDLKQNFSWLKCFHAHR
jgi:hypothetical protein